MECQFRSLSGMLSSAKYCEGNRARAELAKSSVMLCQVTGLVVHGCSVFMH
jgi:hypothetical protein